MDMVSIVKAIMYSDLHWIQKPRMKRMNTTILRTRTLIPPECLMSAMKGK